MEKLFLGVAREIITPKVGGQLFGYRPDIFSESVADDLTATAFYFRQGDTVCLMISATVCLIATQLAEEILEKIEKQFSIPKGSCMLCATHTHSGPNVSGEPGSGWGEMDYEYVETIFVPKVLAAVEKAISAAVPVLVGVSTGTSLVGINRRELTPKNTVKLGQNEWGCFNPRMTVLSFRDESGKPVANIIHYGAHATSAGHNHEITRDWPGVMTDALEQQTGGITAFFNGPEGDVGPRLSNGKTTGTLEYVYEIGAVAAEDAKRIYGQIQTYADAELRVSDSDCRIPLKPRMDIETAKAVYEEYKDKEVNLGRLIRNTAADVLRSYEAGEAEQADRSFRQTTIALDRVIFTGFPYELFSEIGLRIAKAFPTAKVLSIANTNGSQGYFITQDAACRGGYEVNSFLYHGVQAYCDNADWELYRATVNNIQKLIGNEEA